MIIYGPIRWQVLILLDSFTTDIIVTNVASVVESYNKGLVEACSKLRVESIYKAWDEMFMSTNSVALVVELKVIEQWLKKITGLSETTEMETHLS